MDQQISSHYLFDFMIYYLHTDWKKVHSVMSKAGGEVYTIVIDKHIREAHAIE